MADSRPVTNGTKPGLHQARNIIVAVAVFALLAFLSAAFLPRWWAHRIGHQVNGSLSLGITLGLFYGFVFTLLPLLAARWAFHKRRPWKTWGALSLVVLLLAAPNLLTLGIVIGNGNAAHAGERTLDVDAPGYRDATLAGVLSAVLILALGEYALRTHRRSKRELERALARPGTADGESPGPTATE
jgi:MFS family permease